MIIGNYLKLDQLTKTAFEMTLDDSPKPLVVMCRVHRAKRGLVQLLLPFVDDYPAAPLRHGHSQRDTISLNLKFQTGSKHA